VQKAREEGYQIPRAATEARAFAELRRIVRAASARRPRRGAPADAVALPRRVAMHDDLP
jgi:hypothetical protein